MSAEVVRFGVQPDGSYVACPECRYVPRRDEGPNFGRVPPDPVGMQCHRGDCPTVPQVSQETRDRLIEMERVRRRGAAEAWNYVIG